MVSIQLSRLKNSFTNAISAIGVLKKLVHSYSNGSCPIEWMKHVLFQRCLSLASQYSKHYCLLEVSMVLLGKWTGLSQRSCLSFPGECPSFGQLRAAFTHLASILGCKHFGALLWIAELSVCSQGLCCKEKCLPGPRKENLIIMSVPKYLLTIQRCFRSNLLLAWRQDAFKKILLPKVRWVEPCPECSLGNAEMSPSCW